LIKIIILLLSLPSLLFASSAPEGNHTLVYSIAICVIAAGAAAWVLKKLGQPPMLGYLIAGLFIGPVGFGWITDSELIRTISELGLILLLFMIGLEINLKKMMAAGKFVIIPGLIQFPLTVIFGYFILKGISGGTLTGYQPLYIALVLSISSTAIVVKLLYEKNELASMPGRISLGVLIFQDIWAILTLALQPNFANPSALILAKTLLSGFVLVAGAFLFSRYVLPWLFKSVAMNPEVLLIISLAWCFSLSLIAASPLFGLSMEMGALIAGISMATFPYSLDVMTKVTSLRDFFITLFFVTLGMQIPSFDLSIMIEAITLLCLLYFLRFSFIYLPLHFLKAGHRTSLVSSINLAQVSEFSLVILAIGVSLNHIEADLLTLGIWMFTFGAIFSSGLVQKSHNIQQLLTPILIFLGFKDVHQLRDDGRTVKHYDVLMLGFFRAGAAFVEELRMHHPEMSNFVAVVDFNPKTKKWLERRNIHTFYGDLSHPDTLLHTGIESPNVVISSIADTYLKGTTNLKLLKVMQSFYPNAFHILTANTREQTAALYEAGADYVIHIGQLAGEALADQVIRALQEQIHTDHRAGRETLVQTPGITNHDAE
jgi:Kef-type K+ transport system membrane component KefB/voltage-gated potassium channel Kch